MTAIVAIENASLNKKITPSPKALKVEPTVAGLNPDAKYKLEDLLAAILIKSANDAAGAIAEGVSGTREDFVELMNKKAKKIGMENTYFANPSGLPTGRKDGQYTTARDLVRMMRYAIRYKVIPEMMLQKERYICGSDRESIYLETHNRLLFKYDDAPWGKTGYTREAGRTFVGADPSARPKIVFALMKSEDFWNDIMILKGKGLELFRNKHRTFFSDLANWMRKQRRKGRESGRNGK